MFKRPHHQRIVRLLELMNAEFLWEAKCYFGGGTAISLLLDEFRESVDIDFLCSDQEGYRKIRTSLFDHGLNQIFTKKVDMLREVRADREGIRTIFLMDSQPIKFEIVREGCIDISGINWPDIPVPCLTKTDLFAEKLLANADRFNDKSTMNRDVIDLVVMEKHWGAIPLESWHKAFSAYGDSVHEAFRKAKKMLGDDPKYLADCLIKMGIDENTGHHLRQSFMPECKKSCEPKF